MKKFRINIKTNCISYYSEWLDTINFTIFDLYNILKPVIENNIEYYIEFKDVKK